MNDFIVKKGNRIRNFILWYTQFYDTSTIREDELLSAVNEKFNTSYQLNIFRNYYIDKMPDYFKKAKRDDGYYIFERIDINPDPYWTLSYLLEFEKRAEDQEEYNDNEDFYIYLDYAQRHNDIEFENYILRSRLAKEIEKK